MSYRSEIAKMLRDMPPDWRRQYRKAQRRFFEVGGPDLPDDPTPEEATLVLNLTAGGNLSSDATYGPNEVPKAVRDAAMKGVRLSFKHNYGAWDFIGVARAIQLSIAPGVPDETMRRMRNYFIRHRKDKQGKNYRNTKKPSRGRMAWLNWGGDAGFKWVSKKSNRGVPQRYGTSKKRLQELAAQRRRYQMGSEEYDLLPTDRAAITAGKVKASAYTIVAKRRGLTLKGQDFEDLARRALRYYGARGNAKRIATALEKSYDKGLAAWASGGHRPGASSHNWANARISSLLVGGKTYWSTDSKQAGSFPAKMHEAIEDQIEAVTDELGKQRRYKDVAYIEKKT